MTSRVIISLRTRRSWSDGNPVTVRPSETPGQPPRHAAAREHDVDVHDDRHHTTSSSSPRSIVALRNRPRMTTISNANAAPPMATPQPIRTSPGASSISPTCAHSAATMTAATSPATEITPTQRNARSSKIAPRRKEWHLRFCDRRAAPEPSQSAESGSCPHRFA